jgi:release factor glutamine methyltransferase
MALTLGELLSWGKETLKNAGIDDFQKSAELLLQYVLDISRVQLVLDSAISVDSKKQSEYQNLIKRRTNHVPLQHLTGWVEFYNIRLKCNNSALIPRPETEILVETVLNQIKKFKFHKILDIGTGTGNIAITLAKNLSGAQVVGLDISEDALELARFNATANGTDDGLNFVRGDIFDTNFLKSLGLFDCVVSNPPYVSIQDKEKLQLEVSKYEPEIAIFSNGDPLKYYKTIVCKISYILKSGGLLAFEIGMGQAGDVGNLMNFDFKDLNISRDLAGIERVITGVYVGSNRG